MITRVVHEPGEGLVRVAGGGDEVSPAQLERVDVPSHIYWNGRLVAFPLSPGDLIRRLGLRTTSRAVVDLVRGRLGSSEDDGSFEGFARITYGETIARAFLLGYSEKLWGLPARRLSPAVAGRRLEGLNLTTFLGEALLGKRARTTHLEGEFYYPRTGFGAITQALAERCGASRIRLRSRIETLLHEGNRIRAMDVEGSEAIEIDQVVSTLPLSQVVRMLDPAPPPEIRELAQGLRFRNLRLVVLLLSRPQVTRSATLYFPDPGVLFTRVYEPRNRGAAMSPPGRTSLSRPHPRRSGSEPEPVGQIPAARQAPQHGRRVH